MTNVDRSGVCCAENYLSDNARRVNGQGANVYLDVGEGVKERLLTFAYRISASRRLGSERILENGIVREELNVRICIPAPDGIDDVLNDRAMSHVLATSS